ncbi:hypothetical protein FB45DRAFT_871245 [Roridomyces roridus]|uniref:Uncharacterized protein n=1 Tax=Roridomyces roridus TaxID=1738132 RepID=A0AAD7BGM6_9AGAR|nr:hypothetical protein FB45DRAFT_871245 [Roridomyces roridus]
MPRTLLTWQPRSTHLEEGRQTSDGGLGGQEDGSPCTCDARMDSHWAMTWGLLGTSNGRGDGSKEEGSASTNSTCVRATERRCTVPRNDLGNGLEEFVKFYRTLPPPDTPRARQSPQLRGSWHSHLKFAAGVECQVECASVCLSQSPILRSAEKVQKFKSRKSKSSRKPRKAVVRGSKLMEASSSKTTDERNPNDELKSQAGVEPRSESPAGSDVRPG